MAAVTPGLVDFIDPGPVHHLTEDIAPAPDRQSTSPVLLTKEASLRVKMIVSIMIVMENRYHHLTTENFILDLVIQETLSKGSGAENGGGEAEHGMNISKGTMVVINHDLVLPQVRTVSLLSVLTYLAPGVIIHLTFGVAEMNMQRNSYSEGAIWEVQTIIQKSTLTEKVTLERN